MARQAQLIEELDAVATGLDAYAITRTTAATRLHAALPLRHRDQRLQQPPQSIQHRRGFNYGAILERIAFDCAGTAPLGDHIALLQRLVKDLKADLPLFLDTHRFNQSH